MPSHSQADFSAHELVRKKTWQLHKQLDQLPVLKKLIEPDCQLADYERFLLGMMTFYRYYQPLVFKALDSMAPADIAERDKLAALQKDLDALTIQHGQNLTGLTTENIFTGNPAAALGALYVMEGSTQGGRLLQKKMHERFGRADIIHFFTVYGERNSQLWQTFLQHFNQTLTHKENVSYATDGASMIYKVLIGLFSDASLHLIKSNELLEEKLIKQITD
jgi:heme oxygenase